MELVLTLQVFHVLGRSIVSIDFLSTKIYGYIVVESLSATVQHVVNFTKTFYINSQLFTTELSKC